MAKKKDVSAIVSGAGLIASVWTEIVKAVRERSGTDEDIHRLATPAGGKLIGNFADLIVSHHRQDGAGKQPASSFPIWKTIKLGTGLVTADDFRQALKKAGHRISDWANDILGKRAFQAADKEMKVVDLVVVSMKELGFPKGATRQDIYRKAQEMGLMLCPPEVGPQLRLQYPDQPNNEWLLIGMEPITDSDGYLRVFYVGRDVSDSWLGGRYSYADSFWDGGNRWVFLRRK